MSDRIFTKQFQLSLQKLIVDHWEDNDETILKLHQNLFFNSYYYSSKFILLNFLIHISITYITYREQNEDSNE